MNEIEIVSKLIDETIEAQNDCFESSLSHRDWAGFRNISGYGQLNISRKMNDLVKTLSEKLYDKDVSLVRTWTRNDWFKFVDQTLMPMIARCDPAENREKACGELLRVLIASLDEQKCGRPFSFIFGCFVLHEASSTPICFGKVLFSPRLLWLEDQLNSDRISKPVYEKLKNVWQSDDKPSPVSLDPYNSAIVSSLEGTIGACNYVCEVSVDGISGVSAESKAVMAMRFALTGIALAWIMPSKALSNMPSVYDGVSRMQQWASIKAGRIQPGSVRRIGGIGQPLIGTTWQEIETDFSDVFSGMTEVISYTLDASGDVARKDLMDALAHSVLWFHEACCEALPMVAVTKFVASMDALAVGSGGARGLINVVTARLGVDEQDPIRPGGPSFKKVLTELYSQGRSRLLHGASDRLFHDWQSTRDHAEQFARHTLVHCLGWASRNPECKDPKAMTRP
ncbi:MAG: hypothetical protein AB7E24_24220 [Novosphingobium sp.]